MAGKATKPAAAQSKGTGTTRQKVSIIVGIAVVVVAAAALILYAVLGGRSQQKTLQGYYGDLYSGVNYSERMADYLVPDQQEEFKLAVTMGGTSSGLFQSYQEDMAQKVGDPFTVTVEVTDHTIATSGVLNQAKETYPEAEDVSTVYFLVTFDGAKGTHKRRGTAEMVKLKGKWCMTKYNFVLTAAD